MSKDFVNDAISAKQRHDRRVRAVTWTGLAAVTVACWAGLAWMVLS